MTTSNHLNCSGDSNYRHNTRAIDSRTRILDELIPKMDATKKSDLLFN